MSNDSAFRPWKMRSRNSWMKQRRKWPPLQNALKKRHVWKPRLGLHCMGIPFHILYTFCAILYTWTHKFKTKVIWQVSKFSVCFLCALNFRPGTCNTFFATQWQVCRNYSLFFLDCFNCMQLWQVQRNRNDLIMFKRSNSHVEQRVQNVQTSLFETLQ